MPTRYNSVGAKILFPAGGLLLIYLAGFFLIGNYDAFWSEDAGVKFLQTTALLRSGWSDSAIDYPGRRFDPGLDFNPLQGNHARVAEGRVYSIYPLAFPFLSSLCFALFGFPGLYLLPLLSALAAALLAGKTVELLSPPPPRPALPAAAAALGTPLFFYAFTFWELNLAAAGLTGGTYLLLRGKKNNSRSEPLGAGALLGAAVFFRAESALWLLSLVLVHLPRKEDRRKLLPLLAGFALPLAGYLFLESRTGGWAHYFHNLATRPEHFRNLSNHLLYKLELSRQLLFGGNSDLLISWILAAPAFLTAAAFFLRRNRGRAKPILLILTSILLLGHLIYLIISWTSDYPIRLTPFTSGLFLFSPWAVFALCAPAPDRETGRIRTALLIFIGLLALLAPTSGGLQWGPRYLVPIYPLLLAVFWRAASGKGKTLTGLLAAFLLLALLNQAFGLHLLREKKAFNRRLMAAITAAEVRPVAAVPWWIPLNAAAIFDRTEFFAAGDPETLTELIQTFQRSGVEEFLLLTGPEPGVGDYLRRRHDLLPETIVRISLPADRYFTIDLGKYRIHPR